MWTYSTNIMGPFGLWWYEENNIPYIEEEYSSPFGSGKRKKYLELWVGGRIDCYCTNPEDSDYDRYGVELSLPIIDSESEYKLSEWLETYSSEKLEENILGIFEKETGFKIIYFVKGD